MYTLKNIHTSSISALCWSQNGLRLFSGDDTGTVVCSNIDYTMVRYNHTNKNMQFLLIKFNSDMINDIFMLS